MHISFSRHIIAQTNHNPMYDSTQFALLQLKSLGQAAYDDASGRVYVACWKEDLSCTDHLELSSSQVHELANDYCHDNDIFPRYCKATGKGMWKGYCINDGDFYLSSEAHLLEYLRSQEDDKELTDDFLLKDAYEAEVYYYTDWTGLPLDEYDTPPDLTTK